MLKISLISLSNLVIPAALAQTSPATPAPQADPMTSMLMQLPVFAGIFFIFYILLIRPQRQQQKKQTEFLSNLNRGEEVITNGGILGKIVGLTDRVVTLEVGPGTEIKILRSQIQTSARDALTPPAASKQTLAASTPSKNL
jgi:preprotein translocase subunit YajC